jgi:hypothetical protein
VEASLIKLAREEEEEGKKEKKNEGKVYRYIQEVNR